jgi:prepilin-type N-terminal cleavage/methylation domain-containing protein
VTGADHGREDGFTLTELMVGVAIIGILSAGAVVTLRRPEDPGHGAVRMANAVRQCSRLAVARGQVRAPVALALGSSARARLLIQPVVGRTAQDVSVEVLEEDAAPATSASWAPASRFRLSGRIRVGGYRRSSALTAGLGPDAVVDSGGLVMECMPNGATEPMTFYLDGDGSASERARVVVMPLQGEPVTMDGW